MSPLKNRVIAEGLTALARAGWADNCYQGHFGSAMLASYFVCKDFTQPASIVSAIENCQGALRLQEPTLFREQREEGATPNLIEKFKDHLRTRIFDLSRSGHVSIVGMYALRGFLSEPEAITPSRVDGIIKLIEAYMKERPEPRYYGYPLQYSSRYPDLSTEIPEYHRADDAFNLAIDETAELYPDTEVEGVLYYFTGEKLHGLTHAHALHELERLGETGIAKLAYPAHRLQTALNRAKPPHVEPIRGMSDLTPRHVEFWRLIPELKHQLGTPHAIKRSYALLRAEQAGLRSLDDKMLHKLSYVLLRW